MNPCLNCGADVGDDNPPDPQHCGQCPPWECDQCGEVCSMRALCSCWIDITRMPLADVKALFAADECDGPQLSLDPDGFGEPA